MLGFLLLFAVTDSVARDGALDPHFGLGGIDRVSPTAGAFLAPDGAGVALQTDGKLVLGGTHYKIIGGLDNYAISIMRLLPDGTLDSQFGVAGEATVSFAAPGVRADDDFGAVALQSDRRIVVVGSTTGDAVSGTDMAVVRFLDTGVPDPGFGNAGQASVAFNLGGSQNDSASSVALDSQQRILIGGYAATAAGEAAAIVRLNSDGTRDNSFSADGRLTIPGPGGVLSNVETVRELAGHKLLMVGFAYSGPGSTNADFMIARINPDGTLDASFGIGGIFTYGFDAGGDLLDAATDFVELADGSLLISGLARVNAPGNCDFALLKLTPGGALDPAFSPRLFSFDLGGDQNDVATAMRLDARGRILMAGTTSVATGVHDFSLIRLTAAGVLDKSFGSNGRFHSGTPVPLGPDYDNLGTRMLIDTQQHIVLVGSSRTDANDTNKASYGILRLIGDTVFADGFGG